MSSLRLIVTTPLAVVLDETDIASVRAEDDSGGFGILPGHADLLTVLRPSVLRWRRADAGWHHVVLRGGVLRVQGRDIRVACREAATNEDLGALETIVRDQAMARDDASRVARGEQMRMQVSVIRSLMRRMGHEPGRNALDALVQTLN